MKPYDVICEFVKDNLLYTSQPKIENLLPIDMVFQGYGAGGGVMPIVFEPHKDYGKGYTKRCNTDNNEQRIGELNAVNEDIKKYNAWARKKNKEHMDEVFVTIPYDGKVYDEAALNLKTKHYPTIRKHHLWANSFRIASPHISKTPTDIKIVTIDSEQLYNLKESLEGNKFIQKFNATIFAYIQNRIKQEKDLEAWDKDSIWYNPNKEFVHWFSLQGLDVTKIEHFEFGGEQLKDIWYETYLDLAIEARVLKEMGDFDTYKDAYQYMADCYWFQKKGNPVKPEQIGSEWRKAKSAGNRKLDDCI